MAQSRQSTFAEERATAPAVVVNVGPHIGLRQALAHCGAGQRVIAIVDAESPEPYARLLEAGAMAVLPRGAGEQEVAAAVRSALAGHVTLPRRMLLAIRGTHAHNGAAGTAGGPPPDLSQEQRSLLQLLAAGASNQTIGRRLHLTERTVQRRLATLLQRLGVQTRTEAAALAGRWGLWEPGMRES